MANDEKDKRLFIKPESDPKPEAKPEQSIAQAVAAAMKEALPAIVAAAVPAAIIAMEQAKNQTAATGQLAMAKAKMALSETCRICGQIVGDGKGRGCGGPWKRDEAGNFITDKNGKRTEDIETNHVLMVVFPNDPIAINQFDGIKVNGATYQSSGPDHRVWVPRKNDIAAALANFEHDQRVQQVGRKFMRQSGSVSGRTGPAVNNPTFT